ncbi:MAG: sodium:panthothenate symporter, partial [Lentisphaeria bacterium]|nr:sodium:panthothenate symporter [Lentisphaeria bacterium]
WRGALGTIFYVLISVAVLVMLNHGEFAQKAHDIRLQLTDRVAAEVVDDAKVRSQVSTALHQMPVQTMPQDKLVSDKDNLDTRYLKISQEQLKLATGDEDAGNAIFAKFRALYYQQLLPVTLRNMLPKGMLGLFCAMMIMLMVSTDDSRIFSAVITVSQDVVLQFRNKKLTPREQMWMVRW